MRVFTNSDFRAHSAPLFLQLKILDIFKLNEFHVAKFTFCYHHQILPPLFSNLFLFNKQVFQGPSLWNSFAYLHYQFRNPILFQEKTFKLSIEPLLTFVKSTILLPIISLLYLRRTTMRRPLSYKPHGFWGPPSHSFNFFLFNFPTIKLPIETFKQINYIISL